MTAATREAVLAALRTHQRVILELLTAVREAGMGAEESTMDAAIMRRYHAACDAETEIRAIPITTEPTT